MLKEKLKGILIGLLIGAMVTATTGFAVNTTTLYDVITNGIKIIIDGKQLNPTDVNGNPVEPMIYNGTTYLPVRAVANAFDKAVYWDGPEYTVYLGDMDGKLEYPTTYLKDMTNIYTSWKIADRLVDNYDNRYSEALRMLTAKESSNYANYAEYLLNMKYSKFKTTMYIPKGTSTGRAVHIKIVADGKTIYTSPVLDETSYPIDIDVSVKGYNDVKIYCLSDGTFDGEVYLADAGFYQ